MSNKTKQPLGKLIEVDDLRKIWPHEAHDFTPWLFKEENMIMLSEAVGIDIEPEEMESDVGPFRVDIVAKEIGTSRKIIIENQLEDTNHDHLGKLIAYAAGKGAEIIIWIVKKAREEHKAAIEWLNNHTDSQIAFFLCEIKLYRIGDSPIAVKFEVVERPNDWIKTTEPEVNDTKKLRRKYWDAFCTYAEKSNEFVSAFKMPKPSYDYWLNLRIGTKRCYIDLCNVQKYGEISVAIYVGNDPEYFDALEQNRREIEEEMGCSLSWVNDENKMTKSVKISKKVNVKNEADWPNQFDWMIENAIKLKKIARDYL